MDEVNYLDLQDKNINEKSTKTTERHAVKERGYQSDDEKIKTISACFSTIMTTLGLDLEDDSLKNTPHRVAKMYVKEMFSGLNSANKPVISLFENNYQYNKLLVSKNITFSSVCEHHFLPIIGKVHIGYISSGNVIGLSKVNRIVNYFARRPQVQERLTLQIAEELKTLLNTDNIIVVIEAIHTCISTRGVNDQQSSTITIECDGAFLHQEEKNNFFTLIKE